MADRRLLTWSVSTMVTLFATAVTLAVAHAQGVCLLGGCAAATPDADMPDIAPIGVLIDKYMDIPDSAKGLRRRSIERLSPGRSWARLVHGD